MTLPHVIQPIPWILPLHFHEAANGEFNAPNGSVGVAEAAVSIGDLQDSPVLSQSVSSWHSSPRNAVFDFLSDPEVVYF